MHDDPATIDDLAPAEAEAPPDEMAAAMQRELDALRAELAQTRAMLDAAERRRTIDQLLTESEAIDLGAARVLTEAALEQMDDADVALAVKDLRRRCPYLFAPAERRSGGAMSARPRLAARQGADDAADHAAATGDRRDLLRYLRLRRTRTA